MYKISGAGRVRKARSGYWQLVATIANTETGERSSKTQMTEIKCFDGSSRGRGAAEALLPDFVAKIARDFGCEGTSPNEPGGACGRPLVEGIRDFIELKRASGSITDTTAEGYGYSLQHIERGFGGSRPADLTPEAVSDWLTSSIDDGHSLKVMKKAYGLLKQYYNYLLTFHDPRVARNPLDAVPRPRPAEPAANPLRRDLIPRLNGHLRDMEDCPLKRACMLSLHTGMRIGEVVAVTWGDIDWKASTVLVRRSAVRLRGRGMVCKETKGREKRSAPLEPVARGYLEELRRADLAARRQAGIGDDGELAASPIITAHEMHPEGWFMDSSKLSRLFTTMSSVLGLIGKTGETITFHGLRHTFATQWIACGGDVAALSSILGHKDVGFTLNVYVSTDPVATRSGAIGMSETINEGYAGLDEVADAIERAGSEAYVRIKVPVRVWTRARRAARAREGVTPADVIFSALEAADMEAIAAGVLAGGQESPNAAQDIAETIRGMRETLDKLAASAGSVGAAASENPYRRRGGASTGGMGLVSGA